VKGRGFEDFAPIFGARTKLFFATNCSFQVSVTIHMQSLAPMNGLEWPWEVPEGAASSYEFSKCNPSREDHSDFFLDHAAATHSFTTNNNDTQNEMAVIIQGASLVHTEAYCLSPSFMFLPGLWSLLLWTSFDATIKSYLPFKTQWWRML